jgi:hypothetical protein
MSSARYPYQYRRAFLLQIVMHLAEKPCRTPSIAEALWRRVSSKEATSQAPKIVIE